MTTPLRIEVKFTKSKSSAFGNALKRAKALPTYSNEMKDGVEYHCFSLDRHMLKEHGNLLYTVTGWSLTTWRINGIEQQGSAYRFLENPDKFLDRMTAEGVIGQYADSPNQTASERMAMQRARLAETARTMIESLLRGNQQIYLPELHAKLTELINGDRKAFWAAIGPDKTIMATGAWEEVIQKAKQAGITDPILWRIAESHKHDPEFDGFYAEQISGDDGKPGVFLGIKMHRRCTRCHKEIELSAARCLHCGNILNPKRL